MGYEATFGFDLVIPAAEVEKMEHEYFRVYLEDDDPGYKPGDFCKHFNDAWGDYLAEEDKPVPLMALASGTTRGAIHITGYAHKKWRDWEEPLLESIAPYIQAGGTVEILGEDNYKTNWEFDGECMVREDEEYIRVSARQELEAKEKELEIVKARLERAEGLLTEHLRIAPLYGNGLTKGKHNQKIKEFLEEKKHPLEQLAECAE